MKIKSNENIKLELLIITSTTLKRCDLVANLVARSNSSSRDISRTAHQNNCHERRYRHDRGEPIGVKEKVTEAEMQVHDRLPDKLEKENDRLVKIEI